MGMNEFLMNVAGFLGTYLLHSTALLGLAWLGQRVLRLRSGTREVLWRTALLAPVATTMISMNVALEPIAGQYRWLETRQELEVIATPVPPRGPAVGDAGPAVASVPMQRTVETILSGKGSASAVPTASADPEPGLYEPGGGVEWRRLLGILAASWLVVALMLTFRWLNGARAGRRLLRDRRPLASGVAHDALLRLTVRAGVEAPALSVSDALGGPATLPSGEICLPGWSLGLPATQLEAMLAHELAHVERRDPWWLAVAVALESLFWLQPVNRLARHRLAGLAELHADARAAELTRDGRALAQCLAQCAERLNAGRLPALAAAMARQGGALSERVRKLIDQSTETGGIPMSRKMMIFAGALALVIVLPSVSVLASKGSSDHDSSLSISRSESGNTSMSLSLTDDEMRLKLKATGDIVFAPDGSGLDTLGPGSRLEVMQETGGVERRLAASGTDDGIDYTYTVDGNERPYDEEAQAWFAEILPMVLRETAINAPERVDYLLEHGGHGAVLDEIAEIRSDFARRKYIDAYAATGKLPGTAYGRLVDEAARIKSDFEMRNALGVIYETQKPRGQDLAGLIEAAGGIQSDFEMRQLLEVLAKDALSDEAVMSAYAQAAASIDSDFELRQALEALMEGGGGPRAVVIAMPVARGISSDFEMRSLLEEAAPAAARDEQAARAWLDAAATIDSDFELRQALAELANEAPASAATWVALFETAGSIGSDHECSSFLVEAAEEMPDDPAVEEAFRSVMETIGSDSDYRRVAKVLEK